MTVTVPDRPALTRVRRVELMQVGTWDAMSGTVTFTADDLHNAVAALDCPAVRRPVLKFGHDGAHGVGLPALGYVDNMAVADDGKTLVGDYAGVPAWLGDADDQGMSVLGSAYPDRSIEGQWDYRCQLGHRHPFVVQAVALLGEERPAVGTLASLQNLAELYGVQVAAAAAALGAPALAVSSTTAAEQLRAAVEAAPEQMPDDPSGRHVVADVTHVREEPSVPERRRPLQVAAAVTSEDVSRAFYASELGQSWDRWIVRLEIDPPAVIYTDDETGSYFYVPVTVGDGSGSDAVTFGEPQERSLEFVPKTAAAAASAPAPLVYASRADTRTGAPPSQWLGERLAQVGHGADTPVTAETVLTPEQAAHLQQLLGGGTGDDPATAPADPPATAPTTDPTTGPQNPIGEQTPDRHLADGTTSHKEATGMDPAKIREGLGLPPDASDDDVRAALAGTPYATPDGAPSAADVRIAARAGSGVRLVDASILEALEERAAKGEQAYKKMLEVERDQVISAALKDRKFAFSRKGHYEAMWNADPDGARAAIASLAPGMIPAEPQGYAGDLETERLDAEFRALYPEGV